jgi:succinate dehydrogenase/fumarate reductase flavoprotein subunit
MPAYESFIDTDILIIGGGSAGCLSAIRAKEVDPSLDVTVFEKGDLMYSGCIARGMDALNIVAIPGFTTPELYVEANTIACDGVVDAPPSYVMAQRSYALLKKLEGWGVYFPKKNGRYQTLKVHPKGEFLVTMKEPDLKVIIARRTYEVGCQVLNRTMGFRLLTEGNRIAGAVGYNLATGEMIICRAKAVILSSGGLARFSLPTSGYLYGVYDFPNNTGDGWLMGYRAGARLTGLEHTTCYCIIKDISAPLLYITLTRGAIVLNGFGQEIQGGHISIKSLVQEYVEDRGPLFIRMRHLSEEKIHEIEDILFSTERPVMERFFQGRGINFRHSDIELFNTEHFLCSGHGMAGLLINERGETSVQGLLAAGDVACVAKGHLTGAFVFGEVAAERAAEICRQGARAALVEEQMEAARARLAAIFAADGPISPHEFEYKVRRLITNYLIPPKNETKLKLGLEWMARFREELPRLVHVRDPHWASKILELEAIIEVSALSAHASLAREESRWGFWHYRTDHPHKDDERWLRHVVLTRGGDPTQPEVSFKAVDTLEAWQRCGERAP